MKVKVIKMANTNKRYEPEFKKKMVRLVLEEGRTIASVNKEYNLKEVRFLKKQPHSSQRKSIRAIPIY